MARLLFCLFLVTTLFIIENDADFSKGNVSSESTMFLVDQYNNNNDNNNNNNNGTLVLFPSSINVPNTSLLYGNDANELLQFRSGENGDY